MANEVDFSGNIVAYKFLNKRDGKYFSQTKDIEWTGGKLTASEVPSATNKAGIYCSRHASSRGCENHNQNNDPAKGESVKVQLLLAGTVVEHEYGLRAEEAWIVGEVK